MAHLIILQEAAFRKYLEAFRCKLNASQWKYFVTVLMGLLHCEGSKTLSGMLRKVAVAVTISGLSRFLISPAWTAAELEKIRCQQFSKEVHRWLPKPIASKKRNACGAEVVPDQP